MGSRAGQVDGSADHRRAGGDPAVRESARRFVHPLGVWDGTRQVYLLKVPRLEAYDLVVSRSGYVTEMRRGTAVDAVTTWDVRLYRRKGRDQAGVSAVGAEGRWRAAAGV